MVRRPILTTWLKIQVNSHVIQHAMITFSVIICIGKHCMLYTHWTVLVLQCTVLHCTALHSPGLCITLQILNYGSEICILLEDRKFAKGCPEYISSAVRVSSCSYQNTVLSFVRIWMVSFWVIYHNFSFKGFITIQVFGFCCWCHCLSFDFCHNIS